MILSVKQTTALDLLEDDRTIEVYYGGAAGGGKSRLGCYWQLKQRLKYPGSRGLLGRATLKALKETTVSTFFDVAKEQGLKRGNHFELTTSQDRTYPNTLVFYNNSLIYLKDLFAYPSDPEFDELGSLEITDGFIDESPQVTSKCKGIVRSRIRYKIKEFGLIPKLLMTGNPSKNWAYYDFYLPNKNGDLRPDRAFVQALPYDNPYLPESYLESLKGLDKNSRERLLYGNWEYDDDPAALINYENILRAFTLNNIEHGEKYLSVDVARFGSDKTVIGLWSGFRVKLYEFKHLKTTEVADKIRWFMQTYNIPLDNVIADEDGVGGGVVDDSGCKGFVNNSSPIDRGYEKDNFNNLKSQCYFALAEAMNRDEIFIDCDDPDTKAMIIQELEQVKQHNMDKDGKRQVLPKDIVKENIGRSPDYSDAIMMRMWFTLAPVFYWKS